LVHAGKYRTEDKLKYSVQRIHKLSTTKYKQTRRQN